MGLSPRSWRVPARAPVGPADCRAFVLIRPLNPFAKWPPAGTIGGKSWASSSRARRRLAGALVSVADARTNQQEGRSQEGLAWIDLALVRPPTRSSLARPHLHPTRRSPLPLPLTRAYAMRSSKTALALTPTTVLPTMRLPPPAAGAHSMSVTSDLPSVCLYRPSSAFASRRAGLAAYGARRPTSALRSSGRNSWPVCCDVLRAERSWWILRWRWTARPGYLWGGRAGCRRHGVSAVRGRERGRRGLTSQGRQDRTMPAEGRGTPAHNRASVASEGRRRKSEEGRETRRSRVVGRDDAAQERRVVARHVRPGVVPWRAHQSSAGALAR